MIRHYYCTKCYKDFSCDYDRDFDFEGTKIVYKDKCDCGGEIAAGHLKPFVNIGFAENKRWSWSMGTHVKDIPKMMKKYPDRVYNPKTGQLLVKNRTHKKKLMKENNCEEYN